MRSLFLFVVLSLSAAAVLADVPPCECSSDADCEGNTRGSYCQGGCYCGDKPEETAELPKQKTEEPQSCRHSSGGEGGAAVGLALLVVGAALGLRRRR